ncbi:MAG: DUF4783 domain-containing protein [Prevotellaceae bacterium]|jgi:hypothetical protein|nr:DUF4783 domain-containing protein [Prevotellaceae bacterium]
MKKYCMLLLIACLSLPAAAQDSNDKASFDAIEEGMRNGNAAAVAAYFANTLECSVLGEEGIYSKAQATMVLKVFFEKHPPAAFTFKHSSNRQTVKYAIGDLQTKDGKNLRVTVFIKGENKELKIQQLRVENNEQ